MTTSAAYFERSTSPTPPGLTKREFLQQYVLGRVESNSSVEKDVTLAKGAWELIEKECSQ